MNTVFQTLAEQMRITNHDIERRKVFMSFTDDDAALLKEASLWIEHFIAKYQNRKPKFLLRTPI